MVEHYCNGRWVNGPVLRCADHRRIGSAYNTTPYEERNNITVEGVASTGQISTKGTVAHREWFDGHVDATANPVPVTMKWSNLEMPS